MIDRKKIEEIVEAQLAGSELFLVDVAISPANEVEVTIDSDHSVDIDACVELSRAIEAAFDRDAEDFELTVTSAGIGQPLKLLRQYKKLIGGSVEVVLLGGGKVVGRLDDATEDSITVSYPQRMAVEGSKKKQTLDVTKTYMLTEIKSTKEHLDFK